MALSNAESTAYTRLRKTSSSGQAVGLTDDAVRALVYIAARDLGIASDLQTESTDGPELYDPGFKSDLELPGPHPKLLYEQLIRANSEAETYLACAAAIHKARLKFQRVLESQSFATMDQVAPRALLQYGSLEEFTLAALLVWRKWFYDLDNRAAQDTGYLFEPVIAGAIGGIPVTASKSPIRRTSGSGGRQVDCLKDNRAYEIKLRMTIAASGQGRWGEEIAFPAEVAAAGYVPVLVVLDPTNSPKLTELIRAFRASGGEAHVGDDAWRHLKQEAGPEMAEFLERYVRGPLDDIYLALDPHEPLPDLHVVDEGRWVTIKVGSHSAVIHRSAVLSTEDESDEMSPDAGDFLPGLDD